MFRLSMRFFLRYVITVGIESTARSLVRLTMRVAKLQHFIDMEDTCIYRHGVKPFTADYGLNAFAKMRL